MKDKIVGKLQEIKGRVTGDKAEELKGKARQKVGSVKQAAGDVRDRVVRNEPRESDRGVLGDEPPRSP